MKILMFDLERGSKTLGNEGSIESMFGFPVLAPSTFDAFTNVITQIYTTQKKIVEKNVGGLKVQEEQTHTVLKNGVQVDALVLDTFSELSKKYMRSLCDKNGRMQMQDWGKLKNKLDQLLEWLTRIPGVVIMNCHSKFKDMSDGTSKVLPYIDGSTKEDISKWFDFVFYTKTINKPDGSQEYVWHTHHNDMYEHAKDRTNTLDTEIPQDYNIVLNAAREKGYDGCKILIIGSPGTGKTMSTKTLVSINEQVNEAA